MRTEVAVADGQRPADALDRVRLAADDLQAAGRIGELRFRPATSPLAVSSHALTDSLATVMA